MSDADADAAAQAKRKYAPLSSKAPRWGATQFLLLGNLIAMSCSGYFLWQKADAGISQRNDLEVVLEGAGAPPKEDVERALGRPVKTAAPPREKGAVAPRAADAGGRAPGDGRPRHAGIGKVDANGFYFVTPKEGERDFYKIGRRTGTDKVTVPTYLPGCLKNDASCTRPGCVRAECRPWGHHYDTIYQQRCVSRRSPKAAAVAPVICCDRPLPPALVEVCSGPWQPPWLIWHHQTVAAPSSAARLVVVLSW